MIRADAMLVPTPATAPIAMPEESATALFRLRDSTVIVPPEARLDPEPTVELTSAEAVALAFAPVAPINAPPGASAMEFVSLVNAAPEVE